MGDGRSLPSLAREVRAAMQKRMRSGDPYLTIPLMGMFIPSGSRSRDGSDVAAHLFAVASTHGFNAAHSAPSAGTVNPITRTVFFPVAERVNDADRKHCVKAKTNTQGEADSRILGRRLGLGTLTSGTIARAGIA